MKSLTKTSSVDELVKFIDTNLTATKQLEFLNSPEKVYKADCPTLMQVYKALGHKRTVALLGKRLADIAFNSGVSVTKEVLVSLASFVISKYGFLKLNEFVLFVARFNAGEYEKLYNKFDNIAIMRSLSTFIDQREQDISYYTDRNIPKMKRVCPKGFTPYQFYMEACRAKKNNNQTFMNKYKEYL